MMLRDLDREEIRCIFEETYPANVRSQDLAGYGEMYTEDALWMAPNVPDRQGIDSIVEGFADTISSQDIDPVFTAEEIEVIDNFAYVVGTSLATIHSRDGSASKQVKFRALWLMKKELGVWKINRQIWNNKPL